MKAQELLKLNNVHPTEGEADLEAENVPPVKMMYLSTKISLPMVMMYISIQLQAAMTATVVMTIMLIIMKVVMPEARFYKIHQPRRSTLNQQPQAHKKNNPNDGQQLFH